MNLKSTLATAVAIAASTGTIAATAPSAGAATTSTYRHGVWAQLHYSTQSACATNVAARAAVAKARGATNISSGSCHLLDSGAGSSRQYGWVADTTYTAPGPVWGGDDRIGGASITNQNGAHSYKVPGAYSTQAAASAGQAAVVKYLSAPSFGAKVTWVSGVKQNAITKKWSFEVDYTARNAYYGGHVEISEKAGVTSPSLGVIAPIPTTSTTSKDASSTTTAPTTVITPPSTIDPGVPEPDAKGIDVSGHTVLNDWAGWKAAGVNFLYTKATEATYYKNSQFVAQYNGAYANGIIRGAYHFAIPSASTGAQQADYFIANGGGWSADGKTLPGAVDLEWATSGDMCYGMSQAAMGKWVNDFYTEYKAKTGIYPVTYTAKIWWNKCVGTATTLPNSPLWLANYSSTPGAMPSTWVANGAKQQIWQNGAIDSKGYDTDVFNGGMTALRKFATVGM